MGKTALIVDDSKSARVVLKRMLEVHELEVDTAESAEEALVYLNDNRPDVIFMDHMMPGMDGFEAVSAIKNNPDTATIPIMMYTSQEGELYVGQARALGAVGVLPKQVEPVEVSKVLQSLRVIGEERERAHGGEAEQPAAAGRHQADLERLDQDLRILIQDLFDQQRAVLRRDLLDSYETIATRVAHEIKSPEADEDDVEPQVPENEGFDRLHVAVAVLLVIAVVFGVLYASREQSFRELQRTNADLQAALLEQQQVDASDSDLLLAQLDYYRQSIGSAYNLTLQAIEWGANQSPNYPYGELPLDDRRLAMFEELSDHLMQIDFAGIVRIESHVGDFCTVDAGADGMRLAPPTLPVLQCEQLGLPAGAAYEFGSRQSVAFANFVSTANNKTGGRIRYEIVSLGNSAPVLSYPATTEGLTAGDWNDIAASNNRIEITLFPDE